jgi:hypothetical protein
MNHLRFETLGQLAATLGLVVSCGGDVRDLGNDLGTATGGASSETGGSPTATGGVSSETGGSPTATGGNATATGGSATATGGSATATGGSGIVAVSTGGWGSTGGQGNTGGETNTGGQSSVPPYITDPTLPVDPTCTCESSDKICNAASECVPRCDDAGRCARWLANRAVQDLFVEGAFLYYVVAATTDPLGNPATNGALYRVETPVGTPTLVASGLGNPDKILGRYKNTTVIRTTGSNAHSIVSVSDTGVASTLGQCAFDAAMRGHWIAYPDPTSTTLMGIDLDGTLEPVVLAQPTSPASRVSTPIVLDDTILYRTDVNESCSIQLSNPALGSICVPDKCRNLGASSGSQFYCWAGPGHVTSFVPPSTSVIVLYRNVGSTSPLTAVFANGWLYINDVYSLNDLSHSLLVRVPTTVGRLPQEILPDALLIRHDTGDGGLGNVLFAPGTSDIFWVQSLPTSDSTQPQYIFSAPLPPQPCDEELPCADSTLVCANGFCGPA